MSILLLVGETVDNTTKTMSDNTTLIVVGLICFVIGFILAKLFGGSSSSAKIAAEKKQLAEKEVELKSELEAIRETSKASLDKVETALINVQNLAVEMANTYHSLNIIKSNLNGESTDNKHYLLQIKDGKLEKVECNDVELEHKDQNL